MGFGANGLGHIAFPYVYLDATYIKASMRALTDGRDPEAERSADYRMERPSSGNTIFNAHRPFSHTHSSTRRFEGPGRFM